VGDRLFCAAAGLAGPAGAEPAAGGPSANLTIRVENVLPSGGILRLGVYDRGRYPDDNSTPIASANVAAISGETTVILRNLPPGLYAIEAFQDVNANGQMDTSWLGLPQEPFGFPATPCRFSANLFRRREVHACRRRQRTNSAFAKPDQAVTRGQGA